MRQVFTPGNLESTTGAHGVTGGKEDDGLQGATGATGVTGQVKRGSDRDQPLECTMDDSRRTRIRAAPAEGGEGKLVEMNDNTKPGPSLCQVVPTGKSEPTDARLQQQLQGRREKKKRKELARKERERERRQQEEREKERGCLLLQRGKTCAWQGCSSAGDKDTLQCCARCKVKLYCGRDHQAADWRCGHKEACDKLRDHAIACGFEQAMSGPVPALF